MLGILPPVAYFVNGMGSTWTEFSFYYPIIHPLRPLSLLHSLDSSLMSLSRFKLDVTLHLREVA